MSSEGRWNRLKDNSEASCSLEGQGIEKDTLRLDWSFSLVHYPLGETKKEFKAYAFESASLNFEAPKGTRSLWRQTNMTHDWNPKLCD